MKIEELNFPTYMYSAEHEPRVFNSLAELEAAGEGWYDSPAKVPPKEAQPKKRASK